MFLKNEGMIFDISNFHTKNTYQGCIPCIAYAEVVPRRKLGHFRKDPHSPHGELFAIQMEAGGGGGGRYGCFLE